MLRFLRIALIVTAAFALCAPATQAATPKPVTKIMGKMKVRTKQYGTWTATYTGKLPKLRAHEYMHFFLYGPRKKECSYYGNGTGWDETGRRRMKTDRYVLGGTDYDYGSISAWCRGKWTGMYQVMTPTRIRGLRAWRVRMTIATVRFRY